VFAPSVLFPCADLEQSEAGCQAPSGVSFSDFGGRFFNAKAMASAHFPSILIRMGIGPRFFFVAFFLPLRLPTNTPETLARDTS